MKNITDVLSIIRLKPMLALIALAGLGLQMLEAKVHWECRTAAFRAFQAEQTQAYADRSFATARALSMPKEERDEANEDASEELNEELKAAMDRFFARVEVCAGTEEKIYNPEIDPDNFCTPEETAASPNPYRPLVPGTTFVYESETEDGLETIRVEVTHDTKEILGVECIVVHDIVVIDGETIEDTFDWFAQDKAGNVWYFGEISFNYEDGEIVNIDGSWKAGVDGAKPGIIAFASPVMGTVFRQEFLIGEAEDVGEVLSLDESADVPYGSFEGCLMTADYTPIEPDVIEFKFYAPGVGFVLEVKPAEEEGEEDELVELVAIEVE